MTFIKSSELQKIRQRFPIGTRVQLLTMEDPYTTLKPGATGTVAFIDDIGTIHVNWDQGGTLGIIYGVDRVVRISKQRRITLWQTGAQHILL